MQSHTFAIFKSSHMQSSIGQIHLDSLTYFQLLFPALSLVQNLNRNRLELSNISEKVHSTLPLTPNVDDLILWEDAVNYTNSMGIQSFLIKHNRMTVFPPFLYFNQWYFTSLGEVEMKKLQRLRQVHVLGTSSPESFLQIALLFAAGVHDSKVSLLSGYLWSSVKLCHALSTHPPTFRVNFACNLLMINNPLPFSLIDHSINWFLST